MYKSRLRFSFPLIEMWRKKKLSEIGLAKSGFPPSRSRHLAPAMAGGSLVLMVGAVLWFSRWEAAIALPPGLLQQIQHELVSERIAERLFAFDYLVEEQDHHAGVAAAS